MFQFSVEQAIMPVIELSAMEDVNKALERLRKNQVRYRAVLVN